jgi:ubiquinone/menaquinone biosynthesis C-methylase UbiE
MDVTPGRCGRAGRVQDGVMDEVPTRQRMALSFGQVADTYEQGRPGYPAEAVAWLLPGHTRTVADVGAGTGKLSASLAAAGHTVIAIDPDEGMLARLGQQHPGIERQPGSGERLPLPDHSVDAVTYGQAWHWVDVERASAEAARVLTPGGVLGLIWNILDEREPWVERLTRIMHASAAETMTATDGPRVGAAFGPVEHWATEWSRELVVDDVLAMAASRSYISTAAPQERDRILREIRELLASDPATSGRQTISLPHVTHVYRATLAT